ncbi:MAG: clostripain-related cysteine peptidase [Elusimicrobiaceae bacterium]
MKRIAVFSLLALNFAPLVCAQGSFPAPKEWTVLVYLNGKNNIAADAFADFNELEAVGSSGAVNIVAELGLRKNATGYSGARENGTRRYFVRRDADPAKINSPIVAEDRSVNMGSWRRLADFVAWAKKNYPAKRYMLVVYNHGSGWQSLGKGLKPVKGRGISYDDENKDHITALELPLVFQAAGKVDVFFADACRMQDLPGIYEIRRCADFIIGSQADVRHTAMDYVSWLGLLSANPKISPRLLALAAVKVYGNFYAGETRFPVNLSVINAGAIDGLMPLLNDFSSRVAASAPDTQNASILRRKTINFGYADLIDLGDFVKKIGQQSSDTGIRGSAGKVNDYIGKKLVPAIFNNSLSAGATGLSAYVNYDGEIDESYFYLSFARDSAFTSLLKAISGKTK